MDEREAQELLDLVETCHCPGAAKVRQLANGEHVVIHKGYYLWSKDDFRQYQQPEKMSKRSYGEDAGRGINTVEQYRLLI